jgi:hypothetical protein
MSTPAPSGQLPTRQQLDEIDALLRRMLSLPSMAGESSAPSAAPPAVSFPAPAIREVPPPSPPAAGEPVVQSWRVEWPQQPPPAAPQPSVAAWGAPVNRMAETPPWLAAASAPSAAIAVPFANPVAAPPAPPPGTVDSKDTGGDANSLSLLAIVNGAFNLVTYLLGPLGAYLRGPGRNLLGWAGIAMIVAAGVWAAGEWYGYEWPRLDLSKFRMPR